MYFGTVAELSNPINGAYELWPNLKPAEENAASLVPPRTKSILSVPFELNIPVLPPEVLKLTAGCATEPAEPAVTTPNEPIMIRLMH